MFVAVTSLYRAFRKTKPEHGVEVETHLFLAMAIGAAADFLQGCLAIGGGIITYRLFYISFAAK